MNTEFGTREHGSSATKMLEFWIRHADALLARPEEIAREAVREFADGFIKVAQESAEIARVTAKEAGKHPSAIRFKAAAVTWEMAAECVEARAARGATLKTKEQK